MTRSGMAGRFAAYAFSGAMALSGCAASPRPAAAPVQALDGNAKQFERKVLDNPGFVLVAFNGGKDLSLAAFAAARRGRLSVVSLNVRDYPFLGMQYEIGETSLAFVLFRDGEAVAKRAGAATAGQLISWADTAMAPKGAPRQSTALK
jgi:hypothetical protein